MTCFMESIEKIIDQVDGSMRIEGMPLTAEDKERIRRCAGSEKLVDAEIRALVKKHSAQSVSVHEPRL